ncbi:hypothetical protein [Streptomyces sp. MBT97]|nr:hypothetical protein [Streptomyces sp. MBT97]
MYGIDVESGVLAQRSWRWFQARVLGLLSTDSRLHRHLFPPEESSTSRRG